MGVSSTVVVLVTLLSALLIAAGLPLVQTDMVTDKGDQSLGDEGCLLQTHMVSDKGMDDESHAITQEADNHCLSVYRESLSSTACLRESGCVFVYMTQKAGAKRRAPSLVVEKKGANCMAADGMLSAAPAGSKWKTVSEASGDFIAAKAANDGSIVPKDDGEGDTIKLALVLPAAETSAPHSGHGDGPTLPPCKEGTRPRPPTSVWPSAAKDFKHILEACKCWHWMKVQELGSVREIGTDFDFAQKDPENYLQVDYGCWRNVLYKPLRMPVQFEYIVSKDTANVGRAHKFSLDDSHPELLDWQPPNWAKSDKYGTPYDVGHLVMANHFDGNKELIDATNLMTNVLPQLGDMNRFAWLATEMMTECARSGDNRENVFVIGGCVWPEDPGIVGKAEGKENIGKDNYNPRLYKKFKKAGYEMKIPDFCWKIIATPKKGHAAFYMPNTVESRVSKKTALDNGVEIGLRELERIHAIVSVNELEAKLKDRQTPQSFSMTDDEKDEKPDAKALADRGWSLRCDMKL